MRRTSFEDMNCSIAQCLEVVGEWWTLLIVRDAIFGVTRFDEFRSRLGIARNVLTQRLEHLVAQDIMERVAYQENPVRYDYRLTPKGRSLWPVLAAMRQWGDTYAAPDGPPVEAVHTTCGHTMTVEPVCSECGEHLRGADIRPVLGPGARTPDLLPDRGAHATGHDHR
ncbi:winged helix-turn-helix transcriptional regulator [Nocardia sp. NPDC050406]|uniref:winged helix-turn-helix transcriptional regulator n=1 Tax=Nocardia sp. NPDC050406 TaxID=3364318 RepID=UPI0037AB71DF